MPLQIYDPRERALVDAADAVLGAGRALVSPFRRRRLPATPQRILLLRLERIGDLLMALPGIAAVRHFAPQARIDLVAGNWNAELAGAITAVDRVITLDARWLAREGEGLGVPALLRHARGWAAERYDLAINFEPDVRSNLLLAASGARWTAGYRSGGGGALLDQALEYDQGAHTSDNARRLVAAVFGAEAPPPASAPLSIPAAHRERARVLLGSAPRPLVAMHVSGGRPVKQWDPARFAEVAQRLVATRAATIVLTGAPGERALIDAVSSTLPAGTFIDASAETSLLTLAAVLAEADVMVTGDTGPMHVAAAVGTPIVAVFGPSDPRRYAPRGALDTVVRVDLPCAPCNRIRLPPARCTGVIPDCLALVSADRVFGTVAGVLDQCVAARGRGASA
jgi:ADP-heptose:LPS heptosyltransferase